MCIFSFSMYMIVGRNKHFKSDHQFYLTHELFTLKNEKINDAQSDKWRFKQKWKQVMHQTNLLALKLEIKVCETLLNNFLRETPKVLNAKWRCSTKTFFMSKLVRNCSSLRPLSHTTKNHFTNQSINQNFYSFCCKIVSTSKQRPPVSVSMYNYKTV